ncbi:thioredoxin domain-containing protein [Nocardia farcinica]|uniref:DsbA family protein n=1 Tax=Nocardia farcinica TaxID=37329 RepID=UPI001895F035|nr:thioredoxin domain-containing protein [Nocardia farcinica]MBF6265275.1 thioredoxin domain-containing protein [Nocardia farcinica]MBF6283892.1 thioredoxin domain-containing protein [Nocardia farcinica]MBF6307905.1 thioredoxin domain-containing protein [Nocardia farcinica]MBF6393347.1 thioredoxin domain-containing protein [Nocardia farcinica]MBF6493925.1 thioredoxin domain-containing protein [Nocardia farcinica]
MSEPRPNYTPRPMSNTTTFALGGVALAVIVLIVFLVFRWGKDEEAAIRNDGYGSVHDPAVPVSLATDGLITLGKPDARVTLDVFEDPLCPACRTLERIYGQEIAQQIDAGTLAVRYHFVAFLDPKSGSGDYSTRAIAALQCVADTGDGPLYARFHDRLLVTDQPTEGGDDHSNNELADLARATGAPQQAVDCINTGAKIPAATAAATSALADLNARLDDRAATPSVFHGDRKLDPNTEDWVIQLTK